MTIHSMTGFAATNGQYGPWSWTMDLRSVNGRGLDVRLRLPDWVPGLEGTIRELIKKSLARGSVTLNLRISRLAGTRTDWAIDETALANVLTAIDKIENAAKNTLGTGLAATKAVDILPLCRLDGTSEDSDEELKKLAGAIMETSADLIKEFNVSRADEGIALAKIIHAQLDDVQRMTSKAVELARLRADATKDAMVQNLKKVMDNTEGVDPDRIMQELAMIAVKNDVTEEIDRLAAHVEAARALLGQGGVIGRKFDFLTQEFNREANTLCSKAQFEDLTRVGLDLKAVIDQMREQVQNVE